MTRGKCVVSKKYPSTSNHVPKAMYSPLAVRVGLVVTRYPWMEISLPMRSGSWNTDDTDLSDFRGLVSSLVLNLLYGLDNSNPNNSISSSASSK